MYKSEQESRSAHEALLGGDDEKLSMSERLRVRLLEKFGLGKEVNDKLDEIITGNLDSIISSMEAEETKGSMATWELPGEEGDLPMLLTVNYEQTDDGKVIAMDVTPNNGQFRSETEENKDRYGTTVFRRSKEGEYTADMNYDGRMVPLSEISSVDKVAIGPLTEGLVKFLTKPEAGIISSELPII